MSGERECVAREVETDELADAQAMIDEHDDTLR